jgi:hypothetical protein
MSAGVMRTCVDCGETKPIEAFTPIRGTRYTHTRCKPCRAARARARGVALGHVPSTSTIAQTMRAREAQKAEGVLTCKECGETKPLDSFVRIRQSRAAYYGRCRGCRARRAREQYPGRS